MNDESARLTRFSVLSDDIGHPAYMYCGGHQEKWIVRVDGNEVEDVVTIDLAEGYVIAHKKNEKGNLHVDPETKEVATKTLHGEIEIDIISNQTGSVLHSWPK